VQNARGFLIYGDYSRPDPQREIVDAVADGRVDVAVVWGPLAGYYAQHASKPLDVRPVVAMANASSRFTFEIAMGVRRDDTALKGALDDLITRRGDAIRRVLRTYGVPLR
jgi:mxaJ protein